MTWQTILAIGSGGFIGAILRGYANIIINTKFITSISIATLSVNLIGSLLIGLFFALFYHTNYFSELTKSFFVTGFLGALTTYSTFAIETLFLFNTNIYFAVFNIILNVIGSILFAFIGFKLISMFYIY